MFVLLRNLETEDNFYLYTKNYSKEFERLLIEIYYRDIISGLVEHSSEVPVLDVDVYNVEDWLEDIDLSKASKKSIEAVEKIKEMV